MKEVHGAIFQNRKILLVRKNGQWDLPGGPAGPGETDEESLVRIIKRETGLSVSLKGKVPPESSLYLCDWGGTPLPRETAWVSLRTIVLSETFRFFREEGPTTTTGDLSPWLRRVVFSFAFEEARRRQ